jgi:hypothetical protein
MSKLLCLTAVGLLITSVVGFAAQAGETEYNFTWCGHSKGTLLTASPKLMIWTDDTPGIVTPQSTFKPFENMTIRCMGYHRVMEGKETAASACMMTDPAGDSFIGESTGLPDKPPVWTFLGGTGKWQGISGEGTYKIEAMSKPAADGSVEICVTPTGKYTLP